MAVVNGQFAKGDGRSRNVNAETRKFRELCRFKTPAALAVLMNIIEDEDHHPKLRMEAAKYVLDQGHGKAPAFIAIGDGPILPETLGLGELDALILEHLASDTAKDITPVE